jgi:hypothetical protein
MANKTLNAWGATYLRGCLLYLLVAALVVPLGCVCIGVPLYVVQKSSSRCCADCRCALLFPLR